MNPALSYRACNLFKADHRQIVNDLTGEEVYQFSSRRCDWEEPFEGEADTARIVGKTPIGRATVTTLQMNRPHQLAARQRWKGLRLFP